MRYMNWDVLLFPEGSKIPVQEFRTGCFAALYPGAESSHGQTATVLHGVPVGPSTCRQAPTMACFIPSLSHGQPFRVSIHSWEPPVPNRSTTAVAPVEDSIYFEARVLLDGVCVAGMLFNQQPPWPQIIDTIALLDKAGDNDLLRFPPFHQEILTQSWWYAGEDKGRVKILIAEGIVRGQDVLEESGIAWPNPGLWNQDQQQRYSMSSPSKGATVDPDAHVHSPRRADAPRHDTTSQRPTTIALPTSTRALVGPPALQVHNSELRTPYWAPATILPDPFVDDGKHQTYRNCSAYRDSNQSMLDYSRSITPQSSRDISSYDYTQDPIGNGDGSAPTTSQFDELMASRTPGKDAGSVIFEPYHMRERSEADISSPTAEALVTVEARSSSYSNNQSRLLSPDNQYSASPSARKASNVSKSSQSSAKFSNPLDQLDIVTQKAPANEIKSRKEGKMLGSGHFGLVQQKRSVETLVGSDGEDGENNVQLLGVGEGKRKRPSMTSAVEITENTKYQDSPPAGKLSKLGDRGSLSSENDGNESAGVPVRAPLAMLENAR